MEIDILEQFEKSKILIFSPGCYFSHQSTGTDRIFISHEISGQKAKTFFTTANVILLPFIFRELFRRYT